jgi:Protein of unknown function (DUF1207)
MWPLIIGIVTSLAWMSPALAEDASSPVPPPKPDCRYREAEHPEAAHSTKASESARFPQDDVFRPLLADPKQPQFQASYQSVRLRQSNNESLNAGFIGIGETFGLWTKREQQGCNGIQIGVFGAVFSQFNVDARSKDLINSDFQFGFPVTWQEGPFSARVRLYHQSSHLGDEFLLNNPQVPRINYSFEEADAVGSFEYRWIRVYAGGGYILHQEPETKRGKAQWGVELRGSRGLEFISGNPILVGGADFKALEELAWNVNGNLVGGLEWYSLQATRRVRLLINYYRGVNPYGQFFSQKIETIGIGLYFQF